MKALLEGEKGPYYDIVVLNSAAALVGSGHESSFENAILRSKNSIDNGHALKKLDALISISNIVE